MDVFEMIDSAIAEASATTAAIPTLKDINRLGFQEKPAILHSFRTDTIELVPIGDLHLGHICANLEMYGAVLKYVMAVPNRYAVLTGDLAECATKTSIGMGSYDQNIHLEDQLKILYKTLKPLADAGKILGAIIGNHEMRAMYTIAMNPMSLLCDRLNIPYLGYQGYLILDVNGHKHSVMLFHGKGGSATPAGKLNAMYKLSQVADADVYISGHTHTKMYDKETTFYVDKETCDVKTKTRHYVTAGSLLNYWDNYSEMKALKPEELGVVNIEFSADEINVTM